MKKVQIFIELIINMLKTQKVLLHKLLNFLFFASKYFFIKKIKYSFI